MPDKAASTHYKMGKCRLTRALTYVMLILHGVLIIQGVNKL